MVKLSKGKGGKARTSGKTRTSTTGNLFSKSKQTSYKRPKPFSATFLSKRKTSDRKPDEKRNSGKSDRGFFTRTKDPSPSKDSLASKKSFGTDQTSSSTEDNQTTDQQVTDGQVMEDQVMIHSASQQTGATDEPGGCCLLVTGFIIGAFLTFLAFTIFD